MSSKRKKQTPQVDDNDEEASLDSHDHATSWEQHKDKAAKKTNSNDVSAVNLGSLGQLIKKKKVADEDDDFAEMEKKRQEAQALVKSAELKENLRTGPWILIIHLECAKGLRNADIIGKSDPFCTVTLNGNKVGKTKVINNNLNPVWNCIVRLELDSELLGNSWARSELLIECFDYDMGITKHDFLGRVLLHGENLMRTLGLTGNPEDAMRDPVSYPFRDPPTGVRKKSRRATGELIMSLSLNYAAPPENRPGDIGLKVFIDRAENIAGADAMGTSDPYIKVFWEHKEQHTTKVKKLTTNPKWREDVVCKLPAGTDLTKTQLRLDMYDRDLIGKDDFLGRVTLFAADMVERIGMSTYICKLPGPDAPQKFRFKKRPRGDENRKVCGEIYLGLSLEDDWSDIEALVKRKEGDGGNETADDIGQDNEADDEHAGARARHAKAIGLQDEEEESQLQSISWLLAGGKLVKAQDIERKILRSVQERCGKGSLEHASVMDHLGHQRLRASHYNDAFKLMDTALIMRQKLYDYPAVATSHDSLGQLAYERGQYEEAEIMLNRALASRMKILGEDNPATARTMRSLGCLYRVMGKPNESLRMLTRSSEIIEAKYGADSLPGASCLLLLARHWRCEGKKHKVSVRMCRTVLNIRDHKLGPHHSGTAVALAECAAAFRARGMAHAEYRESDMKLAVCYMERCLQIKEHLFGPRSLRLAKTLTNLAHLYRAKGQHDKSLAAFVRVYELRRQRLGEEHPLTLVSLSGKAAAMAHIHTKKDENGDILPPDLHAESIQRAESKKMLLKALNTSLDTLGRDHPITGKCFKNYVFTKTEDEVPLNRAHISREGQAEDAALGNYKYWYERCAIAIKNHVKSCLSCQCIKSDANSKTSTVQPLNSVERNKHRESRSGSFLGRLVRKGRRQYMDNLTEEKRQSALTGGEKSGSPSSSAAAVRDEDGNIVDIGGDPMGLAERYSALIVQQMDFQSDPIRTGISRPEDSSLTADDGTNKTDLEKQQDQKLIEEDQAAVNGLLSRVDRPDTPANETDPGTERRDELVDEKQ